MREFTVTVLMVNGRIKFDRLIKLFWLLKVFVSESWWNTFIQVFWEKLRVEIVSLSRIKLREMLFTFAAIVINFNSSLFVFKKIPLCLNMFDEYSWISNITTLIRKFCSNGRSSEFLCSYLFLYSATRRLSRKRLGESMEKVEFIYMKSFTFYLLLFLLDSMLINMLTLR